eukprot:jgi/Chrzof1/11453/Cz05g37060.t1
MSQVMEAPQVSSNSWEANTLVIDTVDGELYDHDIGHHHAHLWWRLWQHWGSPAPDYVIIDADAKERQRAEGQAANARSMLHSVDIDSRRLISDTLEHILPVWVH